MSHWTIHLVTLLRRAIADDSGQDVIEYALLGAIVGIASVLTWSLLVTTVFDVYSAADADVQDVSACTPDPGGGGCP
jgi:Flp pilus assembly pilin Flp